MQKESNSIKLIKPIIYANWRMVIYLVLGLILIFVLTGRSKSNAAPTLEEAAKVRIQRLAAAGLKCRLAFSFLFQARPLPRFFI